MAREGIVTRKVQDAVNRIKKPVVLQALYANTKHQELTQGTSGNENWHSWVHRTIQVLGGVRGLFTIRIYLEWQMMRFNEAVRRNQQKAEDRSTAGGSIRRRLKTGSTWHASKPLQRHCVGSRQAREGGERTTHGCRPAMISPC